MRRYGIVLAVAVMNITVASAQEDRGFDRPPPGGQGLRRGPGSGGPGGPPNGQAGWGQQNGDRPPFQGGPGGQEPGGGRRLRPGRGNPGGFEGQGRDDEGRPPVGGGDFDQFPPVPQGPRAQVVGADQASTPAWMTAEARDEAFAYLEEWNPEQLLEIKRMQYQNPAIMTEVVREALEQKQEIEKVEKESPARFALMKEERDLGKKVLQLRNDHQKAPPERKVVAEAELRNALSEQFDKRLKLQQLEADQLEKDLKELRARLGKRAQGKADIVQKRFVELTEERNWTDW